MLNSKSFLALDFGAGTLKIAEFEKSEAGSLRLRQFGMRPLGLEGSQDAVREATLLKALQEVLAEKPYGSRKANVCAPGFHVFSKFVKLPPVDASKVTQIIQYEAQQNVPFPLEEVVWDYQILGTTPTGELEVLLVAIKTDVVEGLFRTAEGAGLRLQLVDVSPAALCNAFRFNYGDLEGCTMLLDIGAKTSNLLFFEKGKVYSRSINIGANAITQDFATESKLPFAEAERSKIEEGFVSLGGAYEEPDNPRQAAISKIARQVMTRLHIQVNQTMQFYRGQQGGSPPQRLFLAGGASILPYTAQFFSEKLNVPVEYFNPFRAVELDPSINLEDLAKVAHSFGEVVGLGLRAVAQCPVELNLMPKSSIKRQEFKQKQPYFIATIFSLVLVVLAFGWFYNKLVLLKEKAGEDFNTELQPLEAANSSLDAAKNKMDQAKVLADEFATVAHSRLYWGDVLTELRRILEQTEGITRQPNIETGLWIEKFVPVTGDLPVQTETEEESRPSYGFGWSIEMYKRYGIPVPPGMGGPMMRRSDEPSPGAEGDTTAAAGKKGKGAAASTNQIDTVNIECRGVNRRQFDPSYNENIARTFESKLRESPFFNSDGTQLTSAPTETEAELTFTFKAQLKLKQPVKM